MPQAETVNQVVAELLASEPSLKGQETQLRQAVEKLLASKPDAPHDEKFIAELRAELLGKMGERSSFSVRNFLSTKWVFLPAGAVAALALLAYIGMPGSNGTPRPVEVAVNDSKSGINVKRVGAGSFGKLSLVAIDGSGSAVSARPQSGGGGGGMGFATTSAMAVPEAAPKIAADSIATSMIAPVPYEPTVFTYKYNGDPLDLTASTLPVLRRTKGGAAGVGAASIAQFMPSFLDTSRLSDLKVSSLSAYEDKEYGMSLFADLLEETVSLSQYYQRWPHPEQQCRDQGCYDSLRIRESDLLSDEQAISLADSFMSTYGLSKAGYGAPQVRNDWRRWYAVMPNKADFWFPETLSVVYPLLVSGTSVTDESGYPYGPTVNVNIRAKRADGVWNLFSQNYESADYEAETDANVILAAATRGGVNAWMPDAGSGYKAVEVTLGTPEGVYLRTWQYDANQSKELLVPALRFPVMNENPQENMTPPEFIVIPLVKELLVRQDGGFGGGPIMLMKGGAVDTVSPSPATPAVEPAVLR